MKNIVVRCIVLHLGIKGDSTHELNALGLFGLSEKVKGRN
jgi:hypothetical protein